MAIHEKHIDAGHPWVPAVGPKPPVHAEQTSTALKSEIAADASVSARSIGANHVVAKTAALFGHWGDDTGGKAAMNPPPPDSTATKTNGMDKQLADTAKKVAADPAEHVKNDPGLSHHVVAAQNVLHGGGGDDGPGLLNRIAAVASDLASFLPGLLGPGMVLIPLIVRLVKELARRQEEERRRLLTPDDAAKKLKADPTYSQRLTIAQDLIKIGGHGKLEEGKYVVEELVKMPIEALQLLKEKKTKVVVCRDSVTDYLTDLKGVKPRGWPPGSTWDTVPGLNSVEKNEVVIAIRGDGTPQGPHVPKTGDGHGASNLVLHEGMHAVDLNALKSNEKARSESSEFIKARDADNAVKSDGYLAQAGEAGRQETFAEVAARYYGGDPTLKTQMPKLYEYFHANPFAGKTKADSKEQRPKP